MNWREILSAAGIPEPPGREALVRLIESERNANPPNRPSPNPKPPAP